jgi:DNA-binding CsgD family transcriptional regulator
MFISRRVECGAAGRPASDLIEQFPLMHLTSRPVRPEDLEPCFWNLGDAPSYEPALRPRVPEAWSAWLREGVLTAKIFEARCASGEVRAVGFGAWVFVSDVFAVELARPARPHLRAQLVRRWLDGEPVLATREQARIAHTATGVTVLHLAFPLSNPALSPDEQNYVAAAWGLTLYETRAYRQAAVFAEVCGAAALKILVDCGLRPLTDWASYWNQQDSTPADDVRPYLVGLTRAEALEQSGSHASQLFMHPTPRFGFTMRQQELLREAVHGATDEALASLLQVSPSAVKKHWQAVYTQVAAAVPGWLEESRRYEADGDAVSEPAGRGSEKRRRLLNYLRDHPEELHFINARRNS